jgi:hypothetical protein
LCSIDISEKEAKFAYLMMITQTELFKFMYYLPAWK